MPQRTVYEVLPLRGVGPIHLGMTPEQVERTLRVKPEVTKTLQHRKAKVVQAYRRRQLQMYYDSINTTEYIKVYYDPSTIFLYEGRNIFDMPHVEALNMIAEDAAYNTTESAAGILYIFPRLEMNIEFPSSQEDREKFQRVPILSFGVGRRGYFSRK